jgi:L,D-transpeptidase ErfK/SrfK
VKAIRGLDGSGSGGVRAATDGQGCALRSLGPACCALLMALACASTRPPEKPEDLDALPSDLNGRVKRYTIADQDTLVDLAVNNDLGYVEILAANPGVDPWLPGTGREILLPTAHLYPGAARVGIVVNVPEQRLYYYPPRADPMTFPIGIGREGFETPLGVTKVVRKKKDPVWYPGPSARADDPKLGTAVKPGPDNPLGAHAFYLGWPGYLIHGTNLPYGIGRRSSRGCVRLYPEDVATLFEIVPIGTQVRVVNEPVKLGWFRGDLYMEAHLTLEQATELEDTGKFTPADVPKLEERIRVAAGEYVSRVDWELVKKALLERRGLPVRIARIKGKLPEPPPSPSLVDRISEMLLGSASGN